MSKGKIILSVIGVILFFIVLGFATGYMDVLYTKTVGKAKKNAKTEVFYETQQFIRSMTIDAQRFYREYNRAESEAERRSIKIMVGQAFADFDEDKHLTGELRDFIHSCKYE